MSQQERFFAAAFLCAAGAVNVAISADPPAPATRDDTIAMQARALGLTVKHDAEGLAATIKEHAKAMGVAAQRGAKDVKSSVAHQFEIHDSTDADKAGKAHNRTEGSDKSSKSEPSTNSK